MCHNGNAFVFNCFTQKSGDLNFVTTGMLSFLIFFTQKLGGPKFFSKNGIGPVGGLSRYIHYEFHATESGSKIQIRFCLCRQQQPVKPVLCCSAASALLCESRFRFNYEEEFTQ